MPIETHEILIDIDSSIAMNQMDLCSLRFTKLRALKVGTIGSYLLQFALSAINIVSFFRLCVEHSHALSRSHEKSRSSAFSYFSLIHWTQALRIYSPKILSKCESLREISLPPISSTSLLLAKAQKSGPSKRSASLTEAPFSPFPQFSSSILRKF